MLQPLLLNSTWSGLTGDGKLPQSRGRRCSVEPGLVNPPVRSLPEQNPATETPRHSEHCFSEWVRIHFTVFSVLLPFQHQVEPVSQDRHPDEPEPGVPPQVEPEGEEEEEGGVQVGHGGRQAEQALIAAVCGLQMDRQLDPPAVQKIHDGSASAWGWRAESGVFGLVCHCVRAPLDFTQG